MSDEECFMLIVITVYLLQQNQQCSLQRVMALLLTILEYIRLRLSHVEAWILRFFKNFSIMRPQIFRISLIYKSSKTSDFDNRSYSCSQEVDESNCDSDTFFNHKNRCDKKANYQINH